MHTSQLVGLSRECLFEVVSVDVDDVTFSTANQFHGAANSVNDNDSDDDVLPLAYLASNGTHTALPNNQILGDYSDDSDKARFPLAELVGKIANHTFPTQQLLELNNDSENEDLPLNNDSENEDLPLAQLSRNRSKDFLQMQQAPGIEECESHFHELLGLDEQNQLAEMEETLIEDENEKDFIPTIEELLHCSESDICSDDAMPSTQEIITRKNWILLNTSTPGTKLSSSAIIEISDFGSHTDLIDFGLRYMNDAQKYYMSDCAYTSYTSQLSDSAGHCHVTARQSRKRKRNIEDWKVKQTAEKRWCVVSYKIWTDKKKKRNHNGMWRELQKQMHK